GRAMTSRASAPALTSQQLAVIQAINTLLLSDDESADTLMLLYINGDNDLADYVHDLVRKVHIGATNPEVHVVMVLDWPGPGNSHLYHVDNKGETHCDFQQNNNYTCDGRYVLG